MSAHRAGSWLVAWCALVLAPGAAAAQLSVSPVQDLSFGQVLPGVPAAVTTNDAMGRAELEIRGSGILSLQLVLPKDMVSAQGNRLPLSFSSNDAVARWRFLGLQFAFDPTKPYTLWLPALANGASLYVGGRAVPGASQAPGHYSAKLTLIVANAGT